MDNLSIIKNFTMDNLVNSLITVFIAIIVYQIIRIPIAKVVNKSKKNHQSGATYFAVFSSVVRVCYIVIVLLILLKINGFDVSTMLAGVGIASVVVGLAVQDTLKDIIRGVSIISEDYFKIGDYVTIGEHSGTVVKPGIRSTKIKDGLTGNIISIANRHIEKAEVASNILNLDIPLPYELKLSKAEELMNEIVERGKELNLVNTCEYRGVSELADSSIKYRLYAETKRGERIQAKRDLYGLALTVMEEHKVSVPYNQLDVHQK